MIIVSITGPSQEAALAQIRASAPYAALVELRLDLIGGFDLPVLMQASGKPVIATCRPDWERGAFRGSEESRLEILASAADLGAAYVDLEYRLGAGPIERFRREHRPAKVIVSRHLPAGEVPDPRRELARMQRIRASVMKLAFDAADACDNAHAFQFLRLASRQRKKAVAIAMGEAGEASRILYKKFGGWATYAAPEGGPAAASGQLPARQLSRLFRADRLTRKTRVFGVAGNPVRHSFGIYIHNPLLQHAGVNAVYCRFPVANLDAFMRSVGRELSGLSVTIPHKQNILRYLEHPDGAVRAAGAANTLIRLKGRWAGKNTDAAGALDAIERLGPVHGKRLLVLGAGGAARAIVYEALRRGAAVTVANRTHERARRLAGELGAEAVRLDALREADVLINATSVGMAPRTDETPLPAGAVRASIVFDAVYSPPDTRFLREAREAGARTVSGLEMYINQAAAQFRLYTGRDPDRGLLHELLDVPVRQRVAAVQQEPGTEGREPDGREKPAR